MGRKRAGRKPKPGKRYPNGQPYRTPTYDRGNDRVQERADRFKMFQGGKAGDHLDDPIGRAWAAGLLDGREYDSTVLRNVGQEYGSLYAMYWHDVAPSISAYGEMVGRGSVVASCDTNERRERRFNALDDLARSAGHSIYSAMQRLIVEGEQFPDNTPPWLERLIDVQRANVRDAKIKLLPKARDTEELARVLDCLCAMVGGK